MLDGRNRSKLVKAVGKEVGAKIYQVDGGLPRRTILERDHPFTTVSTALSTYNCQTEQCENC